MAPMLERAISLGIITEAQARDADAYADGMATRIVEGEISIEQARAETNEVATRDGEAIRRSRARRGLPPISLLAVYVALAAGEDAPPEPELAPEPVDLHPFAVLYPEALEGEAQCGKAREGYAPCRRARGHAPPCVHPVLRDEAAPELAPGEVLFTVPYDPQALGQHIRGATVRMLIRTAEIARENGYTALTLRLRREWDEPTLRAACVREAVRWGLIT